jgi:glutaredoxin
MFKVYYLSYCPHSQATLKTLEELELNNKIIECDNRNIEYSDTDKKIIPQGYSTYPQVLFESTNSKSLFIGGNSEFQELIKLLNKLKKNVNAKIKPQRYIEKENTCLILYNIINKIK